MSKFHIFTHILQGNALFSEKKIYTVWKFYTTDGRDKFQVCICRQFENMVKKKPSYAQEIIWKERSEKAFNSPFYKINSGLDFRPLCQDSHRNHHRGLWKRSRMNRKSNEPVLQHTSCYNICFMLCISIFSWTFIWR